VSQIAPFFESLPATFRYSVEVRNREFLVPMYFDALKEYRAAACFERLDEDAAVRKQIAIPGVFTTDFTVVRALLRPDARMKQPWRRSRLTTGFRTRIQKDAWRCAT